MKSYRIQLNGKDFDVTVKSVGADGVAKLVVNGRERTVKVEELDNSSSGVKLAPRVSSPAITPATAGISADVPAGVSAEGAGRDVTSPLPGVIIGISVNVGDRISAGSTIATLEAMKMENAIEAEFGGTVTAIHVQKGDSVLEGARIVTIS